MEKLDAGAVQAHIERFPEWSLNGDLLQRTFSFDDFAGAMDFVNRVAKLTERFEHHPNIMIRYNKVTLTLTTQEAGGLTGLDFDFASATDELVSAGAAGKPAS